jgi:hypothetical protein
MEAIRLALVNTPLWVWALLVLLIAIGARALRPTTASFPRLAILPGIFFIWGLTTLVRTFSPAPVSAGAWVGGLAVGVGIGRLLVMRIAVRADKARGVLYLPGTPMNLVLILLIFMTKYGFAYKMATKPALVADPTLMVASLGLSGLLTGMLVGRFLGLWLKYRTAAHETLPA